MTQDTFIECDGVQLNVGWRPNNAILVQNLPRCPGIYCEIYLPERGVRIGETGRSIRAKIQHDIRWFTSMGNCTAPQSQLRRTLPIAEAAKKTGAEGFAFFVVSTDPRLIDKGLRQTCERHLFAWVRAHSSWIDWNRQRSWH